MLGVRLCLIRKGVDGEKARFRNDTGLLQGFQDRPQGGDSARRELRTARLQLLHQLVDLLGCLRVRNFERGQMHAVLRHQPDVYVLLVSSSPFFFSPFLQATADRMRRLSIEGGTRPSHHPEYPKGVVMA